MSTKFWGRAMLSCLGLLLVASLAWGATPKPTVLILATGGTIAGAANSNSSIGYDAGAITGQQLVKSVPGLDGLANIEVEQICNIASQDMNEQIWIKLANRVNKALQDKDCSGVVITHGTDTMEETAFFLEQVVSSDKPVICVGSMRPSTALSADGPQNLKDAVHLAVAPESAGRGVLLALNGTIFESRDVMKNDAANIQAFVAAHNGPVGSVDDAGVFFYTEPPHQLRPRFVIPEGTTKFPRVDIIYSCAGMADDMVDISLKAGAKGLVLAGVGIGNTNKANLAALQRAAKAGVPVVRSTRIDHGFTLRNGELNDDDLGFVAALDLSPQKSRILLQLLLLNGISDSKVIQKKFAEH